MTMLFKMILSFKMIYELVHILYAYINVIQNDIVI